MSAFSASEASQFHSLQGERSERSPLDRRRATGPSWTITITVPLGSARTAAGNNYELEMNGPATGGLDKLLRRSRLPIGGPVGDE